MPSFFFDTQVGTDQYRDDGTELSDADAARDEAVRTTAEMARDYLPTAKSQANIVMWVRDAEGKAVLHLALDFAVKTIGGQLE